MENGGDEPILNEEPLKPDDTILATVILIGAVLLMVVVGVYLWKTKKFGAGTDNSWSHNTFSPPAERAAFIEAKKRLDPSKPSEHDELKKLLMRRAIQTIPILLSLQQEGNSIERLYKKGMLTDDMHFKVKELKAFVDQEFQDIQFEADELLEGWSQHIWPKAMQLHQMIQKQAEMKNEELKKLEDEKKKIATDKKKEKEKAKKSQARSANATESAASIEASAFSSSPLLSPQSSSSSSSSSSLASAAAPEPVITPVDAETAKALEAERMAKQLLEEEEQEKKLKQKPQKSKSGKKK